MKIRTRIILIGAATVGLLGLLIQSLPKGEGDGEEHQHGPEVIQEVLESGERPPASYLLLHPEARLTDEELQILSQGLARSAQQ